MTPSAERQEVEAAVMGAKGRRLHFRALKSGPRVPDPAASFVTANATASRGFCLGFCIEEQNQRSDADYQITGYGRISSGHVVEYCRPTEDVGRRVEMRHLVPVEQTNSRYFCIYHLERFLKCSHIMEYLVCAFSTHCGLCKQYSTRQS